MPGVVARRGVNDRAPGDVGDHPSMVGGRLVTGYQVVDRWPERAAAERAVASLRKRLPGVPLWFGHCTGRFWALVDDAGRPRLVEAITADELVVAVARPQGWPWPPNRTV